MRQKKYSKSARANKRLNCKNGQCGGRCLRKKRYGDIETCRLALTKEQEEIWGKAKNAAKPVREKVVDIRSKSASPSSEQKDRKTTTLTEAKLRRGDLTGAINSALLEADAIKQKAQETIQSLTKGEERLTKLADEALAKYKPIP